MRILFVLALLLLVSPKVFASSGGGAEMGAAIVDPIQMTKMEAKMFCLYNDHTRKCQQLEAKWKEERRQRKKARKKQKRAISFR